MRPPAHTENHSSSMPTILTHAAVPLALGLGLGSSRVPRRLLGAGVLAAIAPDFDGLAFKLGIAYADAFGHRGATHSLVFALLLGLVAAAGAQHLQTSRRVAFLFVAACCLSHPLLDMFTNGGLGVAFWWPFSEARYFSPWQVIEVSPIALRRVFSERGLAVLASELRWVWLPALLLGLTLRLGLRATRLWPDVQDRP
ncbi:metal-dependent hydrolase [Niveibacterium sp. SC-1]|uniref:metal-dependent hydrolase n=1 Tax=Niveibacterium sp. SC-1 TaxID=3135646 RepID=UPI00311DAF4D